MTAVWFRVGRELRRRWRATAVLVLFMGLAGAVSIATFSGARRTDTAYRRMLDFAKAPDAEVGFDVDFGATGPEKAIAALPQVVTSASPMYQFVSFPDLAGAGFGIVAFGAADSRMWHSVDRPLMLAGRLPRPERPDEIAISDKMATRRHLRPGSSVRMQVATLRDALAAFEGGAFKTSGPLVTARVVGVVRLPDELAQPPDQQAADVIYLDTGEDVLMTPTFVRRYTPPELATISALDVRLARGADDLPGFSRAARRVAAPIGLEIVPQSRRARSVVRATHLQAVALYAFGALALLACVVVAGQALVRQFAVDADDNSVLRALGMTGGGLVAASVLWAAAVVLAAGVIAVGVAVAVSGRFPVGLARQAEPHPGASVNVAVLALATAVFAAALLGRAALSAALVARRTQPEAVQPLSRVADALARAGSPPSNVAGVRLALQRGRGDRAVPLRSAVAGSTVAVAAIAMAVTFGVSLNHLLATPRLQGWNWDVVVGNPHVLGDPTQNAKVAERLRGVPGLSGVSAATFGRAVVGGVETSVVALDPLLGDVYPPVLTGHEPRQPSEIVVGRNLLRRMHRRLGDEIVVTDSNGRRHRFRVVGTGLFPTAVAATGDVEGVAPGEGAIISMSALRAVEPDVPVHQVFVRYDAHADPTVMYQRLRRTFGPNVLRPLRSSDIDNVAAVGWMPYALAGVVLVFALGAIGHLLVTSVRRRRRDLAVLKTVGFVRRQVSAAVAWQATTLVAMALLVGMPLGIALGRVAWRVAADGLGVVAEPATPALLLLAVPAAVLVANLVAAVPGWLAGRIRPAVVLRTE